VLLTAVSAGSAGTVRHTAPWATSRRQEFEELRGAHP